MSFLRKVAGAFVVLDEEHAPPGQAAEGAAGLEDITKETATLLAQLERSGGSAASPEQPGAGAQAGAGAKAQVSELTAEDVFRKQGLGDSPSSALRLLKLVAGLHMFPREQQLAMVRAMDAADDSWAEPDVVEDARRRQGILRAHLQQLARERSESAAAIAAEIDQARKNGDAVLQEIDRRIAELHERRKREAETTAAALAELEQRQRELEAREQRAHQGVAQVIHALGGLLTFLGAAQEPGPATGPGDAARASSAGAPPRRER